MVAYGTPCDAGSAVRATDSDVRGFPVVCAMRHCRQAQTIRDAPAACPDPPGRADAGIEAAGSDGVRRALFPLAHPLLGAPTDRERDALSFVRKADGEAAPATRPRMRNQVSHHLFN